MDQEQPTFSIEKPGEGFATITCVRELTLFSFEPLEKVFADLFEEGICRVAFEYSQDLYSPSFGGVFLAAGEKARTLGGNICLVDLSRNVREGLKLAGLDSAFLYADTLKDARELLA